MDVDELQHALGGIVLEAAYLERTLREVFSALIGSKYAAVVDGRMMAAALIGHCEQLIRHHADIAESAKEPLFTALHACHDASQERNRVIHDSWAARPGNMMVTLPGGLESHQVTVTARTLDEVRRLAHVLAQASENLKEAMTVAVGPGWQRTEDQLRHELGHDITPEHR